MTVVKVKSKRYKKVSHKKKTEILNHRFYLKAPQIKSKMDHLEKTKFEIDSIKKNYKKQ